MDPRFLQIVDELAIWKFLPAGKDRGTLAVKLAEWCDGKIERAEWLAGEADQFDEYPGPATLRKMIKDKFQPSGAMAPYASFETGPPAELRGPQCSKCNDSGTVLVSGKHEWCECDYGKQLQHEMPRWLDVANRFQPTQTSRLRDAQRAAEVKKQLERLESGYGTEKAS